MPDADFLGAGRKNPQGAVVENGRRRWLQSSRDPRPRQNQIVSDAVGKLLRRGYLNVAWIEATFGDNPAHFAPSSLTTKGGNALKQLG